MGDMDLGNAAFSVTGSRDDAEGMTGEGMELVSIWALDDPGWRHEWIAEREHRQALRRRSWSGFPNNWCWPLISRATIYCVGVTRVHYAFAVKITHPPGEAAGSTHSADRSGNEGDDWEWGMLCDWRCQSVQRQR